MESITTDQYQTIIDAIGWVGSIEILIAYALVSMGMMKAQTAVYQWLNLTGSVFLIVNTLYYQAYPATFLNAAWAIIAVIILVNSLRKKVSQ